jgi:outer membrane scaffolding protein for murein synthesis (MipA/OmpV family)
MKITNVKAMMVKSVTVSLLAGAVALAAPAKAQAQQFVVGVGVGASYYGYYGPDYYARLRIEQERRRHEEWVRAHEFERYHHDHRGRW